jgi:hypothetical protein
VCELLQQAADRPVEAICTALWEGIDAWTHERMDDVTLVVARRR